MNEQTHECGITYIEGMDESRTKYYNCGVNTKLSYNETASVNK